MWDKSKTSLVDPEFKSKLDEIRQVTNKDLIEAIMKKDAEMVKYIIKKNAFRSINYNDKEGNTPLHIAACFGDTSIVRTILDNGASIDWKNNDGNTALHLAYVFKQNYTVDVLIERGASQRIKNASGKLAWEMD